MFTLVHITFFYQTSTSCLPGVFGESQRTSVYYLREAASQSTYERRKAEDIKWRTVLTKEQENEATTNCSSGRFFFCICGSLGLRRCACISTSAWLNYWFKPSHNGKLKMNIKRFLMAEFVWIKSRGQLKARYQLLGRWSTPANNGPYRLISSTHFYRLNVRNSTMQPC